jgi:hypothetical protein
MCAGQRPSFVREGAWWERTVEGLPEPWRDFFRWSLAQELSQRPESVEAFLERFEQSFR